jgi:hypothetical protein
MLNVALHVSEFMNVLFPDYNANIEPRRKKEKEEHTLARPIMATCRDPLPTPL